MNIFLLIAILVLWVVVLFLGFLLLGALPAVALLRWRLEQRASQPTVEIVARLPSSMEV